MEEAKDGMRNACGSVEVIKGRAVLSQSKLALPTVLLDVLKHDMRQAVPAIKQRLRTQRLTTNSKKVLTETQIIFFQGKSVVLSGKAQWNPSDTPLVIIIALLTTKDGSQP